jgi:hypothetical protein
MFLLDRDLERNRSLGIFGEVFVYFLILVLIFPVLFIAAVNFIFHVAHPKMHAESRIMLSVVIYVLVGAGVLFLTKSPNAYVNWLFYPLIFLKNSMNYL